MTRLEANLAARGYSFGEPMVAADAREIGDGALVFVGMRLLILAFLVARRTQAPRAVGLAVKEHAFSAPADFGY